MNSSRTCPMTGRQIVDDGFLESRARVLDVAGFLDRVDRSADGAGADDFRVRALLEAIRELTSEKPGRAERIQLILSDPTDEPIERSPGKGADGAYNNAGKETSR